MIKAILFDFDGVLAVERSGSISILRYISQVQNLPMDTLKAAYLPYNNDLLYGARTHREIWGAFCEKVGCDIPYSILTDAFRNTPLDKDMLALVKGLKADYQIGMVTDNKCDRIEEILTLDCMKGLFDAVSISDICKSGKTERLIFEQTIEKLAVRPEECVFTDNTAENLVVPQEMGIQTILFDDEKRNIEAFKKTLYDILAKAT